MIEGRPRTPKEFIAKWRGFVEPSPILADEYLDICRDMTKADESTFMDVVEILKRNIKEWALEHSPIYSRSRPFYSKEHLEDKNLWYVGGQVSDSADTLTSGTTTGFHFIYRRTASTFERLEWDNHYDMVLDEFSVGESPHILYFFPNHFKKNGDSAVFVRRGEPYLNSHGRSRNSIVHYANFDMYKSEPDRFFDLLFEHIADNPIDVFFTSGPQVNSMCHHVVRAGFRGRIAGLLSQTNERLLQGDAEFLLFENKYFNGICDHMRCWDGGASFFTCRDGNYHLMDNLSWCEEVGGRLVSTDYFNFSSPFVKYWNGDMCKIAPGMVRCDCGRLYREFEFVRNRPFSLGGVCLEDLHRKMILSGVEGIRQVRCYVDSVNVVSSRPLDEAEKEKIRCMEPRFRFVFSVEI